jgi:YaiO family outer membrane protein
MKNDFLTFLVSPQRAFRLTATLVLFCSSVFADQFDEEREYGIDFEDESKTYLEGDINQTIPSTTWNSRVDAYVAYTYRRPKQWSPFEEATCNFYQKAGWNTTLFFGVTAFDRHSNGESNGVVGTIAAWKDWSTKLYTFTAFAKGTRCTYLPRFRFDHDFYFKIGCENQFVIPFGFTYFKYFSVNRDIICSTGLQYYTGRWIFGYRLFFHNSHPGNHNALSHKINITYGQEGYSWTYFDVYWGKEAFEATYVVNPSAVNRPSFGATLNHRHWLGCQWGAYGEIGYVWVESPYILYRALLGLFKEY